MFLYTLKTLKDGARPALFLIFVLCVVLCIFCVVLCIVCFVSFSVLFVCICVLYYCHRLATQLQLNISYHIISFPPVGTCVFSRATLFAISICLGQAELLPSPVATYEVQSLYSPVTVEDTRSFGILCTVEWQFYTEVSGQPIGPILKNQEVFLLVLLLALLGP